MGHPCRQQRSSGGAIVLAELAIPLGISTKSESDTSTYQFAGPFCTVPARVKFATHRQGTHEEEHLGKIRNRL